MQPQACDVGKTCPDRVEVRVRERSIIWIRFVGRHHKRIATVSEPLLHNFLRRLRPQVAANTLPPAAVHR